MKRRLFSILALFCFDVSGAWAADVIYSTDAIGKLLGSDGKVYATASDVTKEDVTISGMIAYINTSENWGLVIGPSDLYEYGTEGSYKYVQSVAVSACQAYNRGQTPCEHE